MRHVMGERAKDKQAASISQMGRFETKVLTQPKNLAALTDLSARWIDNERLYAAALGGIMALKRSHPLAVERKEYLLMSRFAIESPEGPTAIIGRRRCGKSRPTGHSARGRPSVRNLSRSGVCSGRCAGSSRKESGK